MKTQERISKHISYKEGVYSNTATRKGIDNNPGDIELKAMKNVAESVFEPLREKFGCPIRINSFFRSKALNLAVGGSAKSQHCKGEAMDIDDTLGGVTNADMWLFIKNNLEFDQLIWEFGDSNNPDWVHVSLKLNGENRKQCLRAKRVNGRTVYEKM